MNKQCIVLASILWVLLSSCDSETAKGTSSLPSFKQTLKTEQDQEEQRVKKKLAEEKKEQRKAFAIDLIREFTITVMKRISPMSGENARFEIISTSYDYDTEKIVLNFKSDWWALPTGMEDYKENHILKASLILYKDGIYRYDFLEQNNVLERAIKATEEQEALAELLLELSRD